MGGGMGPGREGLGERRPLAQLQGALLAKVMGLPQGGWGTGLDSGGRGEGQGESFPSSGALPSCSRPAHTGWGRGALRNPGLA